MPERNLIARELADILHVIAHPARVRIIEELGQRDCDVNTLVQLTGLPQPTVSQHLAALRMKKLVRDRRMGRNVTYSLTEPWLATWLLDGLQLIENGHISAAQLARAARKARNYWGRHPKRPQNGPPTE